MRNLCVGGIAIIALIFAVAATAKPIDATGTVEEAVETSVGGTTSAVSRGSNQGQIEKAWTDLKAKATTLWGSYFADQPKEAVSRAMPKTNLAAKTPTAGETTPETGVDTLKRDLPDYKTTDKGFTRDDINQAKRAIQQEQGLVTVRAARPGTSKLPMTTAGVPEYHFYDKKSQTDKSGKTTVVKIKKKEIPLLDIGEEETISARELAGLSFEVKAPNYLTAKPLKEPTLYSRKDVEGLLSGKFPTVAAFDEKELRKGLVDGYPVTRESVDKIQLLETAITEFTELPVQPLSQDQQDMLTALILNREGKSCHLVIGLLDPLSRKKEFSEEASFHLGICAQKLKFYSQAVARLLKVIKAETPVMASQAIAVLTADLPREYEVEVTRALQDLKDKSLIPESSHDDVNYVMGKGYFQLKNYSKAEEHAQLVTAKSSKYMNARYLLGIALYSQKKTKQAAGTLADLRAWMQAKAKSDKNISSLIAINIARIYFNMGDFQTAFTEYQRIGKDHPVWVQGLIEQGWTQVMLDDNSGAIGNMHSLHSPYFKAVYKPESYVVRSIGYLNICQYADAYKALHRMEQEYIPWLQKVDQYTQAHSQPDDYYNTVKKYLRSPSSENVDDLPYQVIREMGRGRDFLNYQTAINDKVDEGDRYPEIVGRLDQEMANVRAKLARATARLNAAETNLGKAQKDSNLVKFVNEWKAQRRSDKDLIVGHQFVLKMLGRSRSYFNDFRAASTRKLDDEKLALRQEGGKSLKRRLAEMKQEMGQYIANNELLRFEVFSGAGENIRYQVAGGATQTPNRIPANVKPQKILNWEFDGEYWEDEIGNYRSRAKDNCPQKGKVSTMVKQDAQVMNQNSQ